MRNYLYSYEEEKKTYAVHTRDLKSSCLSCVTRHSLVSRVTHIERSGEDAKSPEKSASEILERWNIILFYGTHEN